ncbi:hypothetical protein CLV59_107296 [Chitinophaga dinghuensis]|uniref:Knr4/Smi1-like domain-containing protein n=1 Tax=Chitinophaga dinghuensis TaxID=1539050 RepID=A0A327VU38_9BACT|nr:SMI1/KNR4 family protein [Chitinophaga dinghuensis]RAJ77529.1 hypothetical protein CLV59_107296 [Chitinophaga dinghuensis]
MSNWTDDMIDYWRGRQVLLNEGTLIEMIAETESLICYRFPGDFKELYLQADGFATPGEADWPFCMWSLERITSEYLAHPTTDFIGFGEWIDTRTVIGFLKWKSGVYFQKQPQIAVAGTFRESLERMIDNEGQLQEES